MVKIPVMSWKYLVSILALSLAYKIAGEVGILDGLFLAEVNEEDSVDGHPHEGLNQLDDLLGHQCRKR